MAGRGAWGWRRTRSTAAGSAARAGGEAGRPGVALVGPVSAGVRPAAPVALYCPPADYGRIASRIYIAWCVAAISLPILAGHLFDLTGGYETTGIIAGCGNLVGVIVALGLPRRAPSIT